MTSINILHIITSSAINGRKLKKQEEEGHEEREYWKEIEQEAEEEWH